jgi:hypothetical protein
MVCAMGRPRYSVRPGGGSAAAGFAGAGAPSCAGDADGTHNAAAKKAAIFQGLVRLIVMRITEPQNAPHARLLTGKFPPYEWILPACLNIFTALPSYMRVDFP